ncbi:MAG: response regulator [Nitrospinae bacterium]|nr:response regulator [Nitrospinota bacterium]
MRDLNILVADNSAWTRSMIRRVLETRFGAVATYEAEDGRRAMALLEALKIDMVITAVELAHTSGLVLLDFIKNSQKLGQMPVIVVSSHEDDRTRVDAIQHGAVRYLLKPFKPDELEMAVRTSWTDAVRRKAKRYSSLPPHTLTMTLDGEETRGEVLDISAGGLAGRFPYAPLHTLYGNYRVHIAFEAAGKTGAFDIGPADATLLRIEGAVDEIGEDEPHCVCAFHFGPNAMDAGSRGRLDQLVARLAAEMPEFIADGGEPAGG